MTLNNIYKFYNHIGLVALSGFPLYKSWIYSHPTTCQSTHSQIMKQWVIVLPQLSNPPPRKWQLLGWESQGFSLSLFVNRTKNEGRNSLNHIMQNVRKLDEMSLQEFQAPNHNPLLFLVLVALLNRSVLILWCTRN